MTMKPATPLLSKFALEPSKTATAGSSSKTPNPHALGAAAAPWTCKRILRVVRYVSLYYLFSVIGLAVTYEGFIHLGKAGNVDITARCRATSVIAARNFIRMVATSIASVMWPTRHNLVLLEFSVVTVALTLYIFNTIDLF